MIVAASPGRSGRLFPTLRRQVAFGLVASAGVLALLSPAAEAEGPSAVGWWWAGRPTASVNPLFSPAPPVPENGFYVSGDPTGPLGVSALRFEPADDKRPFELTIAINETIGAPVVVACATTGGWASTEAGSWDERPSPDCVTAQTLGILSDDNKTITFNLEYFTAASTVDLVLTPGLDPDTGSPATFSTSFEALGSDALVTTEHPPGGLTSTTTTTSPTPTPTPTPTSTPEPPAESVGWDDVTSPSPDPPAVPLPPGLEEFPSGDDSELVGVDAVASDRFAYPSILLLPLLLLILAAYMARTFIRPVVVDVRRR